MPSRTTRRSNAERSGQTRAALIRAARELFIAQSFAGTSTPDIVAAANVTRGALYHHFDDKSGLMQAVIRAEAQALADEISAGAAQPASALDALNSGASAYFDAMSRPGRARLLLVEGPAALGAEVMAQLNAETSTATLVDGLGMLMGGKTDVVNAIGEILGAGFDRAALAIASGHDAEPYQRAFEILFERLQPAPSRPGRKKRA